MKDVVRAKPRSPRLRWAERALALATLALLVAMPWFYSNWFQDKLGQRQPIPFSHRFHAGAKRIGCLFCHSLPAHQANAGIPPVQTCYLCHEHIAIGYKHIKDVREHYLSGRPIDWVQVTWVPDFVFFNHQVHINDNFDCSRCHGDVKSMDRVKLVHDINMGFCVQCHRDNGATHDCFSCHR